MDTRELLLGAILREPDEDTPRLAYADLLEEEGDPRRAEFIRVQVELAGFEPPPVVRCGRVLDEAVGLDGPKSVTVLVGSDELTHRVSFAERVDLDVVGTPVRFHDYRLSGTEVGFQHTPVAATFCRSELGPWPDRNRYRDLLVRQHRLFVGAHESFGHNGVAWSFSPARFPSGRFALPPLGGQFPAVEAPGGFHQTFRRGFVESVRLAWSAFRGNAREIFSSHPVGSVEVTTLSPVRSTVLFSGEPVPAPGLYYLFGPGDGRSDRVVLSDLRTAVLPAELVPFMPGTRWEHERSLVWPFESVAECERAVSEACVRYGRSRAGL